MSLASRQLNSRPCSNEWHYYARSSLWYSVPDLYWKQHPGTPAPKALHVAIAHASQKQGLWVQSTLCQIRLIHTYLSRVFSYSYFESDISLNVNLIQNCSVRQRTTVIGVGESSYKKWNVNRIVEQGLAVTNLCPKHNRELLQLRLCTLQELSEHPLCLISQSRT
jgi:hypothetical protein